MSLPNQLDYSQSISELPECTNYEVTLVPSTGAGSYDPSSVIKFDFQQRGFIDPSSVECNPLIIAKLIQQFEIQLMFLNAQLENMQVSL